MSKGCRALCKPRPRAFVPLDPDRCFVTGFDQREMSALPCGCPPTSVTRRWTREETAWKPGEPSAYREEHAEEETPAAVFIPPDHRRARPRRRRVDGLWSVVQRVRH